MHFFLKFFTFIALPFLLFQSMYIVVLGGKAQFFYLLSYMLLTLIIAKVSNNSYYSEICILILSMIGICYFSIEKEYFFLCIGLMYSTLFFKVNQYKKIKSVLLFILICFVATYQYSYMAQVKAYNAQTNNGETWQKYGAL